MTLALRLSRKGGSPLMPSENEGVPLAQKKFGGIPLWLIVTAGVALVAYWYFQHQSGASTVPPTSTGGGGSAKTGKITVQKGAVSINVRQAGQGSSDDDDTDNDQPKPKTHPRVPTQHKKPNAYDVPHAPQRITKGQAEYAIKHNRPVYVKSGKGDRGWTKVHNTGGDYTYYVGSEVYDWLRDAGQIKGGNVGATKGKSENK